MVFQQRSFPKSIYENIAFGARINGFTGDPWMSWWRVAAQGFMGETRTNSRKGGQLLSGEPAATVCIARAIAISETGGDSDG